MSRVMLVDDEGIDPQVTETYPPRWRPALSAARASRSRWKPTAAAGEALEAARHDDYDLFVSDYRMPV